MLDQCVDSIVTQATASYRSVDDFGCRRVARNVRATAADVLATTVKPACTEKCVAVVFDESLRAGAFLRRQHAPVVSRSAFTRACDQCVSEPFRHAVVHGLIALLLPSVDLGQLCLAFCAFEPISFPVCTAFCVLLYASANGKKLVDAPAAFSGCASEHGTHFVALPNLAELPSHVLVSDEPNGDQPILVSDFQSVVRDCMHLARVCAVFCSCRWAGRQQHENRRGKQSPCNLSWQGARSGVSLL